MSQKFMASCTYYPRANAFPELPKLKTKQINFAIHFLQFEINHFHNKRLGVSRFYRPWGFRFSKKAAKICPPEVISQIFVVFFENSNFKMSTFWKSVMHADRVA
jgi:hypothetical protein